MAKLQTVIDGRAYDLTISMFTTPNLERGLLDSGWDGMVYFGVSKPVGKQRKEFYRVFYRGLKSGEFVPIWPSKRGKP